MKHRHTYLGLTMLALSYFSCSELIEVADISNDIVKIIAPADQTVLNDTIVRFTWEPLEESESYHIQIATPSFASAAQVVFDSVVTHQNIEKVLTTGEFEWRINAQNSAYQTNYTTQGFTIEE